MPAWLASPRRRAGACVDRGTYRGTTALLRRDKALGATTGHGAVHAVAGGWYLARMAALWSRVGAQPHRDVGWLHSLRYHAY
jgi:hypothetical protein